MSKISIKIKGVEWANWEFVSIVRSVDNIAGSFFFRFSDVFKDGVKKNFNFGDEVTVSINDYRVLTGVLEDIELEQEKDGTLLALGGRDTTGVLVDCTFPGDVTEWKNQTVSSLVSTLCSPFGIGITIDDSATTNAAQIVPTFKATEGSKTFDLISELCADHALLPINLGDGRLTLTQVTNSRKISEALQIPGNVQSARFTGSDSDRFSSYKVKGVGIGTALKGLETFIQPSGESVDNVIQGTRPTVIFSETPADSGECQTRADWENRYNAGMSRGYSYLMTSWAQANEKPWDIHTLIPVEDKLLNINREMYIKEIEYTREGDDETAEIKTVFPFTYSTTEKILKSEFDQ